ncbi:hypothetical protein U8335_12850 [Roseiconus lacunae]|uniref:tetratricopeptide repeat protein n=1 Tax=Roseiconus lacunae TaxID=2605694 RepID=UPI0030869DF7|nr:hypothetical protein U8335_12850 [Stieleria sp. HD01]
MSKIHWVLRSILFAIIVHVQSLSFADDPKVLTRPADDEVTTKPELGKEEDKSAPANASKVDLFGNQAALDKIKERSDDSVAVRKIYAMIDEFISLKQRAGLLTDQKNSQMEHLREKQKEYQGLETEYATKLGELANIVQRMDRLAPALNLGRNNPQFQEYSRLKIARDGLQATLKQFPQRKQNLPREINSGQNELRKTQQQLIAISKHGYGLIEGWSSVLSVLEYHPRRDAEQIRDRCELKLVEYPNVVPIRTILGFAHLHLNQPDAAVDAFRGSIEDARHDPDFGGMIQERCQLGLIWGYLDLGELEKAGGMIAQRKKATSRDYELIVCEGRLLRQKGQSRKAREAYRRAQRIDKAHPAAYRMAAEILIDENDENTTTIVTLAKMACERDDEGDFRNYLTLAAAYDQSGEIDERDKAIRRAFDVADDASRSVVEERVETLLAAPSSCSVSSP